MNPYMMYENFIPLLVPQDIGSTVTASSYMTLKGANRAGFLVVLGALTSATVTDREEITVEAATAEDGTEAAIAFSYRKSGALGTNTWGAVTAVAATSNISLDPAAVDDNVMVWIEINPDALAASDYLYVRVKLTDNPDMTACLVTVIGMVDPIYKQTTYVSATASASA
jgi:NAD/NADP transhydrogenase beta subunit